ncbi:hypothetical protein ABFS82_06G030000 [Erythranthe guttata]|nr:PREDICTED: uncharacterized protein LOC105971909 [Erythranthe guttata]|eukprot:XP_012852291.1 PREDICTED: uncharacterized protein LOC105971909 [Erythranthe guttata]
MKTSKSNPSMEKRVNKILRHVQKLQEEKAADQKLRIKKIVRQMNRLQEETEEMEEMESIKKSEEEKNAKFMKEALEELELEKKKIQKAKEKYALARKLRPDLYRLCGTLNVMYRRDSHDSYSPEHVQKAKDYAQAAIDVFNQRQGVEYSVVEVIEALSVAVNGFIVSLTFTAKPNDADYDYEEDAESFSASLHYSYKGLDVTHVDFTI